MGKGRIPSPKIRLCHGTVFSVGDSLKKSLILRTPACTASAFPIVQNRCYRQTTVLCLSLVLCSIPQLPLFESYVAGTMNLTDTTLGTVSETDHSSRPQRISEHRPTRIAETRVPYTPSVTKYRMVNAKAKTTTVGSALIMMVQCWPRTICPCDSRYCKLNWGRYFCILKTTFNWKVII